MKNCPVPPVCQCLKAQPMAGRLGAGYFIMLYRQNIDFFLNLIKRKSHTKQP